jgi:uncharacterized protein (TIGR02611 family)
MTEEHIERWEGEGGSVRDVEESLAAEPRTGRMWVALRLSRKVGVAIGGGGVLTVGVALIFLPGPAIVVIPLGLAILATEFVWARRLLRGTKERMARVLRRRRARPKSQVAS